ncbi:protein of unknown function [Latilactobacillus sakei]|uniref:helix-turn-helix domain-containing protein n=1 Tax=Latilactobacillus sakei TaxID=1599 RepID=UPI000C6F3A39|nr:helix-turn-helix transcriptional regulator [Latilactobacillus sakei]MCB4409870.1 helix-turn-helix transcriptional regulator [Latilactobacillus sakei]SON66752.1 protein of unknown function [Latilactobacillus sakei]
MELNLEEIGQRIANIRKNSNYTMGEFGKLLGGVNKSAVNNWEKGRNLPEQKRLEQIALLGRTTVKNILYGDFQTYVENILVNLLLNFDSTTDSINKSDKLSSYLNAYANDEKFSGLEPERLTPVNLLKYVAKDIAKMRLQKNLDYGQDHAIEDAALEYLDNETQPKSTNHGLVNMLNAELNESLSDIDWLMNKHIFEDNNIKSKNRISPEFANEARKIIKDAIVKIDGLESFDYLKDEQEPPSELPF